MLHHGGNMAWFMPQSVTILGRAALVLASLFLVRPAAGQAPAVAASPLPATARADVPPAPIAPEVLSRDAEGHATVRAVRLSSPLRLDGRLDEEVYTSVPPISGFIQQEPHEGAPATERTDVWLFFDDRNVYFVARCWATDPKRILANELRRDGPSLVRNDYVGFALDTFYDRRNGLVFNVGATGGRRDGAATDERQFDADWNGVWDSAVGRFEGGWTVEVAVPFKTLRYPQSRSQVWGFNVHRYTLWKNEKSYLVPIPASGGGGAIIRLSLAATAVGFEVPLGRKNLEIKPYAVANLSSVKRPVASNDIDGDAGVDAKYGITQNVMADFTYNTDFAQVEVDEQQINLTRFSLFFPEKRDFFLENAGVFTFGGVGGQQTNGQTPILFYSRRIGLNAGRVVPVDAGSRLTGRVGRISVGALHLRTGEEPVSRTDPTSFSVVRVKGNVLRRSSVGMILTNRSVAPNGVGANQAYGVDGTFAFYQNVFFNSYYSGTHSEGVAGDTTSYRAQLDYGGDRYGAQVERLFVGDQFRPEVGFVRRRDQLRDFVQLRFSPRLRSSKIVRKLSWVGSVEHVENVAGRLDTRARRADFGMELHNSDNFGVSFDDSYEFVPAPFAIAPGVTIPVGGYEFRTVTADASFGLHRKLSGTVAVESGSFYTGEKTTFRVSGSRFSPTPRFAIEPSLSINAVTLPYGTFTNGVLTSRITYTMTPWMFTNALVQYNSGTKTISANARLRWEYQPGSELFIVYNEERIRDASSFGGPLTRAFIVKVNRLIRF